MSGFLTHVFRCLYFFIFLAVYGTHITMQQLALASIMMGQHPSAGQVPELEVYVYVPLSSNNT